MVSRRRLLRLGAALVESATNTRVRLVAQLLLVAAVIFVVLRVHSLWHGSHLELAHVAWAALAGSVALAVVGTAAGALIWLTILDALGVAARLRWAGVFFQAQLGKYIPGSVWQYAGRAAVARARGIPAGAVGISLPVEFVASGVAAGSMSAFLLGWWGACVVAAVAFLLVAAERLARGRHPVAFATIRSTFLYLPVWLLLGSSFWLCGRAVVAIPMRDTAVYIGAYAVAWLAGVVAIYAPGGLGVREAVLVALLSSRIGTADAFVVATASRGVTTGIDVALAGLGFLVLRGDYRVDAPVDGPHASLPEPPVSPSS